MFKILKRDKKTKARLGILNTPFGRVKTPAYVIVATHAAVKTLRPVDIKKTKTQLLISNTYHLWEEALKEKGKIKNKEFILEKLGIKIPVMTDSGGFQVFSLGFGNDQGVKKIFPDDLEKARKASRKNIDITERGVYFKLDGKRRFLGPELSMNIQDKIGANIIFAFDECTYLFDGFKYTNESMGRTHRWAEECLRVHGKNSDKRRKARKQVQMLFGIVQGGKYKALRVKSAKTIGSMPFDGFGIGGAFTKEMMSELLKWVIPHLPDEKPRHLLGIGKLDDVFTAIENGVDTFDCVIPTREARHARIWGFSGHYDIRKSKYQKDKKTLDKNCQCPACKIINRSKLNLLFKNKENLAKAQRYATLHNVYFFNTLLENIRKAIERGKFLEYKKSILKNLR
jgi:tRNA-guanine transglycosylase